MATNIPKAPVELSGEFVSAVMRQDYHNAYVLCQALLILEPYNETYIEFEKVLSEAQSNAIAPLVVNDNENTDDDGILESSDSDDDSLTDTSDATDSGNSHSSGDAYINEYENNNRDSSDDSSDDVSTDSGDESDGALNGFTDAQLAKLNLLVGGLSIDPNKS